MCIFEYDEESVIQAIREDEFELGKKEGRIQGEERILRLYQRLLADNRIEDLRQASENSFFVIQHYHPSRGKPRYSPYNLSMTVSARSRQQSRTKRREEEI